MTSPSIVPWGLCGDAPTSAFPGRAADLAFDDSLLALDGIRPAPVGVTREPLKQIVVNLGNIGAAPLSRAVDVLAIGYDSTGNIVWEDLSTANATVSFENPVLPYQWHRLCQIRLIADPLDTVFESNKDNNDQSFATGLCESDPALVPTNHPKLVAWVEWSGSQVVGHILNLGRVAAPQPNIPIETRLEVQDSRGQNLLANELFYSQSMIQGYGEEGIVSWTLPSVLPSQTCQVRFTIDPSGQQAGTAFFIHTAQVSHCQ